MDKRYYRGLTLQKDKELCQLISDIRNDSRFRILKAPTEVEVHALKYEGLKRNPETGRFEEDWKESEVYVGYDYHYVIFECITNGNIYDVECATYYPFDGKWNTYTRINLGNGKSIQATYPKEFPGLDILAKEPRATKALKGVYARAI